VPRRLFIQREPHELRHIAQELARNAPMRSALYHANPSCRSTSGDLCFPLFPSVRRKPREITKASAGRLHADARMRGKALV